MKIAVLSAAIVGVISGLAGGSAHAEPQWQFATGADFSSGEFGGAETTDVIVVPLSGRLRTGAWTFRVSAPYIWADGPADVSVLLDDSGGGSNSGPGGGGGDQAEDDGSTNSSGGAARQGFGDTSVSISYTFAGIAGSDAYVDLIGRARLPTGDEEKGLGVGATDYGAGVELGWNLDGGGVYLSGGRRLLGDSDTVRRVDGWQAGVGGWLRVTDRATLGAFYDWRDASVSGRDDPSEIGGYVSYRTTDHLTLRLSGTAGLSDASADYGVGVAMIVRSN